MNRWSKRIEEYRIVSLKKDFLDARANAETKARDLLNNKMGNFDKHDVENFLEFCNTERVQMDINTVNLRDNSTNTRFQLSFIGANKKNIINSLNDFNRWVPILWQTTEDMKELDRFWGYSHIKGAGTGLPTMVMYLKNPDKYNVWIPFLSEALSVFIGRKLDMKKNITNYMEFNDTLSSSIQRLGLQQKIMPQEIDYILY